MHIWTYFGFGTFYWQVTWSRALFGWLIVYGSWLLFYDLSLGAVGKRNLPLSAFFEWFIGDAIMNETLLLGFSFLWFWFARWLLLRVNVYSLGCKLDCCPFMTWMSICWSWLSYLKVNVVMIVDACVTANSVCKWVLERVEVKLWKLGFLFKNPMIFWHDPAATIFWWDRCWCGYAGR